MNHNPFARPRPNPKRAQPRRTGDRVRLRGNAKKALRSFVAGRAKEYCETCGFYAPEEQVAKYPPGELSHKRHGANKSDTPEECLWECRNCHRKRHNAGGKPVPRKAGRTMNQTEALAYWNGDVCFCGETKGKRWSFCFDCLQKLSPQLRDDLEKVIGKDYLETMAAAETELLAWKPAEEQTA